MRFGEFCEARSTFKGKREQSIFSPIFFFEREGGGYSERTFFSFPFFAHTGLNKAFEIWQKRNVLGGLILKLLIDFFFGQAFL